MKKLAAISLVLAMTAASLAGCGSTADTAAPAESEAAETTAATTEETTDAAADTEAKIPDTFSLLSVSLRFEHLCSTSTPLPLQDKN